MDTAVAEVAMVIALAAGTTSEPVLDTVRESPETNVHAAVLDPAIVPGQAAKADVGTLIIIDAAAPVTNGTARRLRILFLL